MRLPERLASAPTVFFLPGTVLGRPGVARITNEQGGRVRLALENDPNSGVWVPRDSLSRSIDDLRGKITIPSGSPDPALDAASRGEYTFLGKGDDGLCLLVPSLQEVIKAASTAPRRPFLDDHRTTVQADRELEQQCKNADALRTLGIPIAPHRFVLWAGRAYQITPFLDIPKRFTPEQLKTIEQALSTLHGKGWALRDRPQAGTDSGGSFFLFDTGKATQKATPEEINTDKRCLERLKECNLALFRRPSCGMFERWNAQTGGRMDRGGDILSDEDEECLDEVWARFARASTTKLYDKTGPHGGRYRDLPGGSKEYEKVDDAATAPAPALPPPASTENYVPPPSAVQKRGGPGVVDQPDGAVRPSPPTPPSAEELAGATFEEIPGLTTLNRMNIRKVTTADGRHFFWKGLADDRIASETTAADLARICGLDAYSTWGTPAPLQAPAGQGGRGILAEWVQAPTVAHLLDHALGTENWDMDFGGVSRSVHDILAKLRPGEADRHALFNFLTAMPDRHFGNVAVRGDRLATIDHEFFALHLEEPEEPCQFLVDTRVFAWAYKKPRSHEFDPDLVNEFIFAAPRLAARVRQEVTALHARAAELGRDDPDSEVAQQCRSAAREMDLEARMIEQRGNYLKAWVGDGPLDVNRLTRIMEGRAPVRPTPPAHGPVRQLIEGVKNVVRNLFFAEGEPVKVQLGFQDQPLATGTLQPDGTVAWEGDSTVAAVIHGYVKPGQTGEELLHTLLARLQGRWWCVLVSGNPVGAEFVREKWPKGTPGGLGGKWKPGTGVPDSPAPVPAPSEPDLAGATFEPIPGFGNMDAQHHLSIRKVTTADGRHFFWKGIPEYLATRESAAADIARLCGLESYSTHVVDTPPQAKGAAQSGRGMIAEWVKAPNLGRMVEQAGADDIEAPVAIKTVRDVLAKARPGEADRHALFSFLAAMDDRHLGNVTIRGDRVATIDHEQFGSGDASLNAAVNKILQCQVYQAAHDDYKNHPFDPQMVKEFIRAVPAAAARTRQAAAWMRGRARILLHNNPESRDGLQNQAAAEQTEREALFIEQRGRAMRKWLAASRKGKPLTFNSLSAQVNADREDVGFAVERWPGGSPNHLGGKFKPGSSSESSGEPPSSDDLTGATFEKLRGLKTLNAMNIRKVTLADGRQFFWKGVPEVKVVREETAADLARIAGLDAYATWGVDTPPGAREAAESQRGMLAEWVDTPTLKDLTVKAKADPFDPEQTDPVVRGALAQCRPGEADRHALFGFVAALDDRHLGNFSVRGDRLTTLDHESFGLGKADMAESFSCILDNQMFTAAHDIAARHPFDPGMVKEMIDAVPALAARTNRAASELKARAVFLAHADPKSYEAKQCRTASAQMEKEAVLIEQRGRVLERWLAAGGELTANSLLNEIRGGR